MDDEVIRRAKAAYDAERRRQNGYRREPGDDSEAEGEYDPSRNGNYDHEPEPRSAAKQRPGRVAYVWDAIDSPTFAAGDYAVRWLVEHILVALQPGILAGPRKGLKTTIAIALVIALGTGRPFLDVFKVFAKRRVALLSGESGEGVIQETAKRICAAMDVDLADVDARWGFKLPQLGSADDLEALADGLKADGIEVLIYDPVYLGLIGIGQDLEAGNLFQVGPLLAAFTRACLSNGVTPILAHHFRKGTPPEGEQPDLDHLSWSGFAEFARQWVLLGRREPYEPGSGLHKLWMIVGGSQGHNNAHGLDIDEGKLGADFQGRKWEVEVIPSSDARAAASDQEAEGRREKNQAKIKSDGALVLLAIDKLSPDGGPVGFTKVRDEVAIGGTSFSRAVHRLIEDGILVESPIEYTSGHGKATKRTSKGLMRRPKDALTVLTVLDGPMTDGTVILN